MAEIGYLVTVSVCEAALATRERAWDDLISDLYRSAIDPEAAGRVPERLAALTGGVVASAWRVNASDLSMVGAPMTNLPPEAVEIYRTHYYQFDPWASAVRHARLDEVLTGNAIVGDADLWAGVYYNEFAKVHGMFHPIGVIVPVGSGRAGIVSVLQPQAAGAFDDDAVSAFRRALPHIKSAFQLAEQVDASLATVREAALDGALDALGVAAAVLDGACRVLRVNRAAEAVEVVRRGLTRRGNAHSLLQADSAKEQHQLATRVAAIARGEAGGQFRMTDGTCVYLATVTPLPVGLATEADRRAARALLLLRPLAGRRIDLQLMMDIFGMTVAEAAVALALAEGGAPKEIAAARDVKVSTVRTLLQRAQDKANCRNLRELVAMLTSLG